MIKLEVQPSDPAALLQRVFDTPTPVVGATAQSGGLTITNMTAGAENIDTQSVLLLIVENKDAVAQGVAAAVLWDSLKGVSKAIWIGGRKVLTKADLEAALSDDDDDDPNGD